uniref:ATP synthase F0 subunit 8 n=1 Tax=Ibla cumingi TaxID=58185 RepID=UPI0021CCF4C3|nr:ATP synthase F0 subunit 8 [Ibla cumingi]UWM12937.1 ATP synthase F0 subunit 8 [Ibla cumingi]
MPHMAPIMWTLIFIFTFLLFTVLLSMIYFSSSPNASSLPSSFKKSTPLIWSW